MIADHITIKTFTGKGDWYVSIYDRLSGKHIKKFYSGLKSTLPDSVRLENIELIKKIAEQKLRSGELAHLYSHLVLDVPEKLSLRKAYDLAFEFIKASDLAPKTKADYSTHHKQFLEVATKIGYDKMYIDAFKKLHFHQIITEIAKTHGNHKYNKHLGTCKAFFKYLVKNFIIEENPAHGISEKKHNSKTRVLPTQQEQTLIINHFREYYPPFIVWLKTLYHLKIRMEEMRKLKVGMIDTENWHFTLPPEITKNHRYSKVIIPDDLKEDLQALDLSNPDFYLFGVDANRRTFIPAARQLSKDVGARFWKKHIKDGLGIQVDQYSIAYKGATDKMRNGMSLDDVKEVFRHSDKSMTRIYAAEAAAISMEKNKDKFGKFE